MSIESKNLLELKEEYDRIDEEIDFMIAILLERGIHLFEVANRMEMLVKDGN